jgi:hypothetical protein
MLVVMTVNAKILPIAAVRGIIQMVSILMVDCKQKQAMLLEFPAALDADPTVDFEGLFPVAFNIGTLRPHSANQFIGLFLGNRLYRARSAGFARFE